MDLKMYFQSRSLNILCIARFTCEGFLLITARGVFLPPGAVFFVLMSKIIYSRANTSVRPYGASPVERESKCVEEIPRRYALSE